MSDGVQERVLIYYYINQWCISIEFLRRQYYKMGDEGFLVEEYIIVFK